jgi:hypothetical protein
MMTHYAFLVSLIQVMSYSGNYENEVSDYTDQYVFGDVRGCLTERQANYIYTEIFGLRVSR